MAKVQFTPLEDPAAPRCTAAEKREARKVAELARRLGYRFERVHLDRMRQEIGGRFWVGHQGSRMALFASDDVGAVADWLRNYGRHSALQP